MKIPNQGGLQKTVFNHSSDVNFEDFYYISKKFTAKPYSFLVNDIILVLDKPLHFRHKHKKYSWKLIIRLEMKNFNI